VSLIRPQDFDFVAQNYQITISWTQRQSLSQILT
jgi:hypothetical protein